jgi:hypothetical protein
MSRFAASSALILAALALGACATASPPVEVAAPATSMAPPAPGIAPQDLVGRWGFAAYHKEADRARTIAAARGQCGQPYAIARGPEGGVLMHTADASEKAELVTKGAPDGKRYLGPPGPLGDPEDREFVSFDGRVMTLRWINAEIASRYGTSVYVRCGARA